MKKEKGNGVGRYAAMKGIVGKNGLTKNKKEGDGKSPIGMYSFGTAFGSQSEPCKTLNYLIKSLQILIIGLMIVKSKDYNKWVDL